MITAAQLHAIAPYAHGKVEVYIGPLQAAMIRYAINTRLRIAAFIAQILHESGEFHYVQEIASGAAYEGRHDLGNTVPGDGIRFKGRGLIQLTGRTNYRLCGDALGLDLVGYPEFLELPNNACLSAAWFWDTHQLNALADHADFEAISRRINGGMSGWADRVCYYDHALKVIPE